MTKRVRALILAAGIGSRLKPLTTSIPKCLVKVSGAPVLGRWLKELDRIGTEAVLINTHYKAEKVENYIHDLNYKKMKLSISREKKLLGTAGTLIHNKNFFENSIGILIHADNVTDFDLSLLLKAHYKRSRNAIFTMLTFNSPNPSSSGIVEIDKKGLVKRFHEKIQNPPSNRANAAIYIFEENLFDSLEEPLSNYYDFSLDIIPDFIGKIQTFHTDKPFIDIGTPETLELAKNTFKN
ncbi:nucleotidyltransferase family protein [Prochlorococcus marinus XMU1411]|uniref:nucleotidyltransferase family protein n=1 Tax=Prochlorococcus marinus TaxID=1219 RepID=UPI001ADB1DEE|nr:nucleotidyltransferase family protein [Prochlorococcus marinus]MBO8244233.1 nucleotidyltransferase family protein [Prochlorococcus marinus XMU1411]MBW3055319.1 nucleotidyl transferase [Prochlorococcus marinus str. MU1411]MCR8537061.1 nucleotidyltransferase family protein [Prochlorococcus marinus CUG1430]